jgi:hypothetical protein
VVALAARDKPYEPSGVLQLLDALPHRAGALEAHHGAKALQRLLDLEGLALLGQADDGV